MGKWYMSHFHKSKTEVVVNTNKIRYNMSLKDHKFFYFLWNKLKISILENPFYCKICPWKAGPFSLIYKANKAASFGIVIINTCI